MLGRTNAPSSALCSSPASPNRPRRTRCATALPRTEAGSYIRTVQALRGHAGVATTMIYKHAMRMGGMAVCSLLDRLTVQTGTNMQSDRDWR
jgi:hypothetical protein